MWQQRGLAPGSSQARGREEQHPYGRAGSPPSVLMVFARGQGRELRAIRLGFWEPAA